MINYLNLARELNIQGNVSGEELRAKCPLHQDSHPSFSLNIKSGMYNCFSRCGGGDFHDLVKKVLGLNSLAAMEWINTNGTSIGTEHIVEDFVQVLYGEQEPLFEDKPSWLLQYESLQNNVMPQWFLDRGFTWETVNHWDIRCDPVLDFISIPVKWQGEIVGTVNRNKIKEPKYENSQDLPRNDILFGEISKAQSYIIICEGALDCLWLWQNGYNATALLGTSFNSKRAKLLSEYGFGEVILALDNDEPGKEASQKIMFFLKQHWLLPQITRIIYPEGKKDPNDCSQEELKSIFINKISAGKELLFS